MSVKFCIAALCLALLGGGFAWASEVGNNPEGTGWKLDLGYERSATEVELKDPALIWFYQEILDYGPEFYDEYTEDGRLDRFTGREVLDKYYLAAAYGFGERYVVYLRIGMARMNAAAYDPIESWSAEEYRSDYGDETFNYSYLTETVPPRRGVGNWDPFYGAGFKAVLHDAGGFKVGLDLQYNRYKLDADVYLEHESYYYEEGPPDDPDPYDLSAEGFFQHLLETHTTEYQAALVFSKQSERFSPFGGVKLSQLKTDYRGESRRWDTDWYFWESWDWTYTTQSTDNVGLFVGADWAMTGNLSLGGELQVGDQNATAVKLTWKF